MAAAAILDFGKTVAEIFLTPIFQVSVTLTEHKSVIVLLLTIIILPGTGGPGLFGNYVWLGTKSAKQSNLRISQLPFKV